MAFTTDIESIVDLALNALFSSLIIAENIFIIGSNGHLRNKRKKLRKADVLVNNISAVSLTLDVTVSVFLQLDIFQCFCDIPSYIFKSIVYLYIALFGTMFWLIAFLCVFYCLKIVRINVVFFVWLKAKIVRQSYSFLVFSLVFSLLNTWPVIFVSATMEGSSLTANVSTNLSCDITFDIPFNTLMLSSMSTATVLFALPMVLMLLSCFVTVHFLRGHFRQMRENATHFRPSPSLKNEIRACKMIIYLAITYTLCSLMAFLSTIMYFALQNFSLFIVMVFVFNAYRCSNELSIPLCNALPHRGSRQAPLRCEANTHCRCRWQVGRAVRYVRVRTK
uniref:Taste receptor type 2 n=1 Tax=Erpetoichthys calabaricus TaxID=27687 RepID=A0A8C4TK20_ERPCA